MSAEKKFDIDEEEIHVVNYRTEWSGKFQQEAAALSRIFNRHTFMIEHIGSTAVPGLKAKPIVDIAVKFDDVGVISEYLGPLTEYGYHNLGEFILPRWHILCRGIPREFNLHVVDGMTEHWRLWTRFREILLADEHVREDYQKLKTELAGKYRYERKKYTDGKADFVNSTLARFAEGTT